MLTVPLGAALSQTTNAQSGALTNSTCSCSPALANIKQKQRSCFSPSAKLYPVICCSCGIQEQFCLTSVSAFAAVAALKVFSFIYLALTLHICVLSGGGVLCSVSVFVLTSRYSPAAAVMLLLRWPATAE